VTDHSYRFNCLLVALGSRSLASEEKRQAALLVFGVIVGGVLLLPVKILLPRPRPYSIMQGLRIIEIEGGGSFTSGHSRTASQQPSYLVLLGGD